MVTRQLQRWLEIDTEWTERAGQMAHSLPVRWAATVLAHSGDSLVWLVAGVLMWRFGLDLWARLGERMVIVTALTWLCTTLLKLLFQRPRPEGEQKLFYLDIDVNSFPSGHAVRVGGLVTALGPLLPGWGALVLALWALCVGISRVVLGLHYISDVVAGLVVGSIAGLVLIAW
jgi:undecaprenyl-diphosphatase